MSRPVILLINPMGSIVRLVESIIVSGKSNLNYYIVLTAKSFVPPPVGLEQYTDYITVVDLKTTEWNFDVNFVTGIAFDYNGQVLLESVRDQMQFANPGTPNHRINKFLSKKIEPGNLMVETISYQGRHIVVAGWEFLEDNHIKLQTKFDQAWNEIIEVVFEALDDAKVVNGPAQVYFDSTSNQIGIKLHPSNIPYKEQKLGTSRYWFDIWETVTALQLTNPISAQRKFYNWVEETGTSKTYIATPLTL